jgi:hypothetical protein
MANVFDQFDAPAPAAPVAGAANPFDQFDAAPPALQPPASGADVSARATAALQPFFERGLAARNSAGQWTPEARARLTKEGLNPLEIDHEQEKALLAAYQAQTGARTGDGAAAIGRGLINGIPVAGPALLSGTNKAMAFLRSVSFGIPYEQALKDVEGFGERTANANSGATTAGEIAGGVLGTAPAVVAAPAAFGAGTAPILARAATSAATSGLIGGADAAARSGGDLATASKGALAGAALGAAAPYVGAVAGKAAEAIASKIKPGEAIPAIPELRSAARAAYERADDAGVQVAQPAFADAVKGISTGLREAGIDRTLHPKATAVLARLDEAAGTAPTLQDLDLLRRVAKGAASSLEPDERRLGKLVVDKLDDFVNGLKPADLLAGDAEAATKALGDARGLWARASKAQRIEDAVEGAERQAASVGSGGNVNNATRQAIRRILDNPKQRAGYTADEIEAMEAIVRGGSVQNALRLIGKLSPQGNGLMAALGLGATAANPLMAAGPIAGLVAKKVADRGTTNAVQRLSDLVRSGGDLPVSPLALPAREGAEQLARFVTAPLPIYADQILVPR